MARDMFENLTTKIIRGHLVSGRMVPGEEIGLRVDQTLTQDATGTMAYLQFEALGRQGVACDLSVSYVDHNMLQTDYRNADDHRYLRSMAAKHGLYLSRPGNGICHQVHLERFARPGATLLGSDSHTPTAGGIGSLAIGSGGLDVAVAMAGGPYYLTMPRVALVRLVGYLEPGLSAKDVALELLRCLTVKGAVGFVLEYGGSGLETLTVPERATIANMGTETGATTSIFPSDVQTLSYLRAQGRDDQWVSLVAEPNAEYDRLIEVDLNGLEPLIAQPSSPDNVVPVREVADTVVHQVCVGSCTNSSYADLMTVASILKGHRVHPDVSLTVSPGSQQVLRMLAENGALADLIAAGARILECACGPCIGMGQAPPTGAISLRTFNRNFSGRSGTANDQVYLASPATCAASALSGSITDPRTIGYPAPKVEIPDRLPLDDTMILPPPENAASVSIMRGPNIVPISLRESMDGSLRGRVLLVVGDNITTDHIMPAGAKILPLRSNIPAISEYVFTRVDPRFAARAREWNGGFIVAGVNYGQGSSREHAALAPMYLGVKAVLAQSYARIHQANLVNFGILPLLFVNPSDYAEIGQGHEWEIAEPREALRNGGTLAIKDVTNGTEILARHNLSPRQVEIVLAGGLLNYIRTPEGTNR